MPLMPARARPPNQANDSAVCVRVAASTRQSSHRAARTANVVRCGDRKPSGDGSDTVTTVAHHRSTDQDRRVCRTERAAFWLHLTVASELVSLADVLSNADSVLSSGGSALPRTWASGFTALDTYLGGGLRAGELILLSGPQGLGKTTLALQAMRNIAAAGGSAIYLSFEHEEETLLERLLCIEASYAAGVDAMSLSAVRRALAADDSALPLEKRLVRLPGGPEALKGVQDWGQRVLIRRCGSATTVADIRATVEGVTADRPVLVVDYLQKIAGTAPGEEDERVTVVVQELKDLALQAEIPVLAIVAADKEGIAEGKRLRIQHLRGSTALAYEADVILIMNDKFDVVARHHLVYDVGNAERFRNWVVVTIEKNRNGLDRIDLEFEKHFSQGRFDAAGKTVTEQLVDERVFVE